MRNLLALFGAALLTVVGLGWYLGWYKVRSQAASVPGQHSVNIDIDTRKIGSDLQKGEERVHQILEKNNGGEEARKAADSLTLPSPSAPNAKTANPSTPLFQYHSGNGGPSLQIGGDAKHPLIQIGGDSK